ncbi:hypothetical protein PB2503_10204 [Parvularcula bermudensis HTCC2503]|uniref:Uncharacterized protein n=1 Tax=Parvularcula bermudensis (strain ATCC BAA-594 / HTCC2503 / KCTC 12087) TaxID=314260 RepID=E0TFG8_PARBH|nr:hypothetical protein [Parvularcula bermudensis]ADM10092.1 hypothetical protein PB2503_10204 [Parvularcula bermudensis HTCC2503]
MRRAIEIALTAVVGCGFLSSCETDVPQSVGLEGTENQVIADRITQRTAEAAAAPPRPLSTVPDEAPAMPSDIALAADRSDLAETRATVRRAVTDAQQAEADAALRARADRLLAQLERDRAIARSVGSLADRFPKEDRQ